MIHAAPAALKCTYSELSARRVAWLAAVTLAAALLVACGGGSDTGGAPAGWRAEHDTIGDTVVVRTIAGAIWGDSVALVPELTIGQLEGPDEYMFGQIAGLAGAPDRSMYVYDRQVPALRKYAPDGRYLGRVNLPPGARIGAARGEHAWVIQTGKLGVQSVVRYRIQPRQAGEGRARY